MDWSQLWKGRAKIALLKNIDADVRCFVHSLEGVLIALREGRLEI